MESNKYQNSKIYKIVSINGEGKYYIGSTTLSLQKRFSLHKSRYKRWKMGKTTWISLFDLFEESGVDNYKIELIEDYPCKTKQELYRREGELIREMTGCVNICIAGRTKDEYRAETKEYAQAKFVCDKCRGRYTRQNISHHKKSKKHRRAINELNLD